MYITRGIHYTYRPTVLPPNSRFLGPGIFRELEIRELIIHEIPPIHCSMSRKNSELEGFFLINP